MLTKEEFDRTIESASDPATRIETLGALLAKSSGLGPRLVIVGGSAISIYSQGRWVSDDVDIVGEKRRIVPVLRRWGFVPIEGRDGRVYWTRKELGFAVDLINRSSASGSGRSGRLRTVVTKSGPVLISAVEDLIVRRLVFWSRDGKPVLMDQAVALFDANRDDIDLAYLEGEVRWERVGEAYRELQRLAGPHPQSR